MKTPLLVGVVLMVHVVALSCVFLMPGCRTADVGGSSIPEDQPVKMPDSVIVEQPFVPVTTVTVEPKETLKAETTEYVIGKNECLSRIASQYKLSVSEILALNNMKDANKIRVGQKILLPGNVDVSKRPKALKAKEKTVAPAASASSEVESVDAAATSAVPAAGSAYLVKKGDSLGEIAKEHKVKISALKKANNLTSDNIRIGQKLVIPGVADTAAPADAAPVTEPIPSVPAGTVPPVDDSAPVSPAPAVAAAAAPAPVESAVPAPTPVLKRHKVMPGEDIYGIGIMYNVSIQKLKEVNNLATDKPAPGTELIIPDNV